MLAHLSLCLFMLKIIVMMSYATTSRHLRLSLSILSTNSLKCLCSLLGIELLLFIIFSTQDCVIVKPVYYRRCESFLLTGFTFF